MKLNRVNISSVFTPDFIVMCAVVMEVRPDTFRNILTHFLLLILF